MFVDGANPPAELQTAMRARDEAFYAADAILWGQYTAATLTTVQQNKSLMTREERLVDLQMQTPRPYVARSQQQHEQRGDLVVARFFSGGLWVPEVWARRENSWAVVMSQATTAKA